MTALISWLGEKIYKVLQWFIDTIWAALQYIETLLMVFLHDTWENIVMSLASLLNAIPVPDFMTQAHAAFSGLPGFFLWVAVLMKLPEGLSMIMAAYAFRFLLRRIPLIG
jgi:phage-related protein